MSARSDAVRERALVFDCAGEQLLGILSSPADGRPASGIAVVLVVGGPQYRVGSHRQFTLLARTLAARGHHCLRFDYRGMGDSTGASRDFLQVEADIESALATLRMQVHGLRRVVLWGLCDAASAILLHLDAMGAQANVDGIVLLNPWVRSDEGLARTQVKHYYAQRLREKEFWLKLLSGKTGLRALAEFLGKLRQVLIARPSQVKAQDQQLSYQQRMARALRAFPGPVLLLLSGDDFVAKEFLDHTASAPAWQGLLDRSGVERHDLVGMDHTFSRASWRDDVATLTASWIERLPGLRGR